MLTKKSTVKSKLSKRKAVKKMKEFDMTPAGKVVYYPHLDDLPMRKGSALTPKHIVDAIEKASKGDWCSWYTTEKWTDDKECKAGYKYCHADLSNDYAKSFYLDLVNWQKLGVKSVNNAKKIYNMLVSKDSPWVEVVENAYLIYDPATERLLGVYYEDLGKAIPKDCRRLFVNFLIALRSVSEHRANRDAWAVNNPFGTLLGWFISSSLDSGYGHNWMYYGVKGKVWVKNLFNKKHSNQHYDGDHFSSSCNGVYSGAGGDPTPEEIKEVEKELGYV